MGFGLRALLHELKDATENNGGALNESDCLGYSKKYDRIIRQALEENKSRISEFIRQKELRLINRLEKHKEPHLLFMRDPNVPFDNNRSERAVRGSKVHSKITGGFRAGDGSKMCCAITTISQTSRWRGEPAIVAFRQLAGSQLRAIHPSHIATLVQRI